MGFVCTNFREVTEDKSMQRSGAEATRTQIQPSKLKLEITNITIVKKQKKVHGQPSEQQCPKR